MPDARFAQIFVAHGAIEADRRPLTEGDAARHTDTGPLAITSTRATKIVVWESDSEVTR